MAQDVFYAVCGGWPTHFFVQETDKRWQADAKMKPASCEMCVMRLIYSDMLLSDCSACE